MSAWLAIFRAELRRALPLLPWFALVQLLMFFIRSGTGPAISDRLAFWIEWAAWILAALILIPSIWSDSPSRDARFIATRPVKPWTFHTAKLSGLLVLVVLPFAAVEFASLVAVGMSGEVVILGTLQIALFALVAVLSAFPVLWLWRGRIEAILGISLMPVAILWVLSLVSRRQQQHDDLPWATGTPQLICPPVLMLALASIAVLLGCLLLYRGRFRRTATFALYLPLSSLGACFALWCATRPLALENPVPVALASLTLQTSPGEPKPSDRLEIRPASPAVGPQLSIERSVSKLVVNGHDLSPWALPVFGSLGGDDLQNSGVQEAFRTHYGSGIKLLDYRYLQDSPAFSMLSFARDADGKLSLDLAVRETSIRWEVVGDLPVMDGASLRHGDIRWSLRSQQQPDGVGGLRSVMILSQRYPELWLGSLKAPLPDSFKFFGMLSSGRVLPVELGSFGDPGSRSTLREHRLAIGFSAQDLVTVTRADLTGDYEPPELPDTPAEWPEDSRLVIVQAIPVSQTDYTWKSPAPIPAPTKRLIRKEPDSRAGTVMEWLGTHPVPGPTSNGEAASAWLDELLPRIGNTMPQDADYQRLFQMVGSLVVIHPDRVHDAPQNNYHPFDAADELLEEALAHYLPRDAIQRFPKLREDPVILQIYQKKGWGRDVLPAVAERVRLGTGMEMADILLVDPQAAGFSEAEWLALFRLRASPYAFRVLRGKFIPADVLDQEADRVIDRYFVVDENSYSTDVNPLFDLVLTRGRKEGPRWLREWILGWKKRNRQEAQKGALRGYREDLLRRHFELPPSVAGGDEPYDWFLAQDPAAFRFNPESRKYQIP